LQAWKNLFDDEVDINILWTSVGENMKASAT